MPSAKVTTIFVQEQIEAMCRRALTDGEVTISTKSKCEAYKMRQRIYTVRRTLKDPSFAVNQISVSIEDETKVKIYKQDAFRGIASLEIGGKLVENPRDLFSQEGKALHAKVVEDATKNAVKKEQKILERMTELIEAEPVLASDRDFRKRMQDRAIREWDEGLLS
jgi:hypothetical protein